MIFVSDTHHFIIYTWKIPAPIRNLSPELYKDKETWGWVVFVISQCVSLCSSAGGWDRTLGTDKSDEDFGRGPA